MTGADFSQLLLTHPPPHAAWTPPAGLPLWLLALGEPAPLCLSFLLQCTVPPVVPVHCGWETLGDPAEKRGCQRVPGLSGWGWTLKLGLVPPVPALLPLPFPGSQELSGGFGGTFTEVLIIDGAGSRPWQFVGLSLPFQKWRPVHGPHVSTRCLPVLARPQALV